MGELDELDHCRDVASRFWAEGQSHKVDKLDLADLIEKERAASAAELEARFRSKLPSYGTVAVNQLLAHLESEDPDKRALALIQAVRASYQVR